MAVRLHYKITATISSTTSEEADIGNVAYESIVDSQGEGLTAKVALAGAATDVQLNMSNIADAKFILLRATSKDPTLALPTITVKKNSNLGEAITMVPMAGSKESLLMINSSGITSLYLTNGSASTVVDVMAVIAGD